MCCMWRYIVIVSLNEMWLSTNCHSKSILCPLPPCTVCVKSERTNEWTNVKGMATQRITVPKSKRLWYHVQKKSLMRLNGANSAKYQKYHAHTVILAHPYLLSLSLFPSFPIARTHSYRSIKAKWRGSILNLALLLSSSSSSEYWY